MVRDQVDTRPTPSDERLTKSSAPARANAALKSLSKMSETEFWLPNRQIVLTEQPKPVRDRRSGMIIGLDAMIRVYNRAGVEVPVDPHRIIINPPTSGDFKETFWEWLSEEVEQRPLPKAHNTRGTTTTVYADMSGYVQSSSSNYSSTRSGNSLAVDTALATFLVGQRLIATEESTDYMIWQGFLSFNTSSITGTVSSATLSVYCDTASDPGWSLEARTRSIGGSIGTSDWVAGSSLSALTLLASRAESAFGGGYTALTSETAFLAAINQLGNTQMLLCSSDQPDNDSPGEHDERLVISSVNTSGTSEDPKLVIIHNTPTTRSSIIL